MKTVVVTAGAKGADIDVLACVVAYAELLALEGVCSIPVIPGQYTMSITPSVIAWGASYETTYSREGTESFVLVDISDYEHVPDFVDLEKVCEVYDHRYGHEKYWEEKIPTGFHIEMVGACGTLIWEEYKKRGKENLISRTSARLLLASVVSNTLNFRSTLTTERDRRAYKELVSLAELSDTWISEYFTEQENILFQDFEKYVKADTKVFTVGQGEFAMGQIELWNADRVLTSKKDELASVMAKYDDIPWAVNIINISGGGNYVYSRSELGKRAIERALGVAFEGDVAKTTELIMRKQITKLLRETIVEN